MIQDLPDASPPGRSPTCRVRVHETFIHVGTPELMSREYMCPCAGTTLLGIPDSIPLVTQRLVKTRLPWFLEFSRLLCGATGPDTPLDCSLLRALGVYPPASAVRSSALLNRHALGRTSLIRVMRPAGGVTRLTWRSLWTSLGVRGRRSGALRCALSPGAVPGTAWRSGRPSGSGCSCLGDPRGDEHRRRRA